MLNLLAFDYGASSGRAILGSFDRDTLRLREIHRFQNGPVTLERGMFWDFTRLYDEMLKGISKCINEAEADISGVGIDTWGVDFGLLDSKGKLLSNPRHYRDSYTNGMIDEVCKIVSKREIYEWTGIAFQKYNTLYQLFSMKLADRDIWDKVETVLLMPDLLNYFLTGVKASEYTISTTTQMCSALKKDWEGNLITRLGIPGRILKDIISPCTVLGKLRSELSGQLNTGNIPVIAVAGHDTACAVAAVPASTERYVFLSSGTWSLMGFESPVPVINQATFGSNYTNEGGICDTYRVLKNIMGLWIFQECKREWDKAGEVFSFGQLEEQAMEAEAFTCFIDPDGDLFYSPGGMPDKIREFCKTTGQVIPESKGAIIRCIMESLAFKYRMVFEELEEIAGFRIPVIHVVGGGSRNSTLNRFTANAVQRTVIAGPVEATAVGNLISQLIALGEVADLKEARSLVKRSFPLTEYLPADADMWEAGYLRFLKVLKHK